MNKETPEEQAKGFIKMCKELGVKPELSFKEQFPSLKMKEINGNSKYMDDNNEDFYKVVDVQKHCIDKQRVKDVLDEKISNLEDMQGIGVPEGTDFSAINHTLQTLYELKKELNLE